MNTPSLSQQLLKHAAVWFVIVFLLPVFPLLFTGAGFIAIPAAFLNMLLTSPALISSLAGSLLVVKLVHLGSTQDLEFWHVFSCLFASNESELSNSSAYLGRTGPTLMMAGLATSIAVGWINWVWGMVGANGALATGNGPEAVKSALTQMSLSGSSFAWGLGLAFGGYLPLYFKARLLKSIRDQKASALNS